MTTTTSTTTTYAHTSVPCPAVVDDEADERCEENVTVAWFDQWRAPQPTGYMACRACGLRMEPRAAWMDQSVCEDFEGDRGPHRWDREMDDGEATPEIVSWTTVCGHTLTERQISQALEDAAVAYAERQAERA